TAFFTATTVTRIRHGASPCSFLLRGALQVHRGSYTAQAQFDGLSYGSSTTSPVHFTIPLK
ncbi:MAG: hypothetical protein WAM42_08090, partial [Candidatus Nitrosopolaris sp.]